jgi:hypothetical protein
MIDPSGPVFPSGAPESPGFKWNSCCSTKQMGVTMVRKVIVCFVDVGGIVDHHFLFLFLNKLKEC